MGFGDFLKQNDKLSLFEIRTLFDAVIEKFPQTASHLNANASIVVFANFESAIVKLFEGNAKSNLTDAEKTAIGDLGGMAVIKLDSSEMSFAVQIWDNTRRKVAESDFKWVPGTSNKAERLFRAAKLILGDLRRRTSPLLFEMLLFLKANREFWGVKEVEKLLNQS